MTNEAETGSVDPAMTDAGVAIDRFRAVLTDPELEAQFHAGRKARNVAQLRFACIPAFIMILIFAVLDYTVINDNAGWALLIRLGWSLPSVGILYAMTFLPFFQSRIDLDGWIVIVTSTASYAALNAVSNTPEAYFSGYIIILLFLYFLIPVGFLQGIAIGVTCTVAFSIFIPVARDIALGQLLTIYSQLLVTIIAGSYATYQVNVFRRLEFIRAREIAGQNRRYHDLLTRILPETIVARMQAGEEQIADDIPHAAVLFADVVGFTESAAKHSPETVIRSLNALFGEFDNLVARHGLEKIKTIGDAYMVAGGVPERRDGFVDAMANLALDMLDAAARTCGPDGKPLQIRIGLHTGPLVAGVIGDSRFGYDLWGDTVNLASRMQATAKAGAIQVTGPVRDALDRSFVLQPRGEIDIKGKGSVAAWTLSGRKSAGDTATS